MATVGASMTVSDMTVLDMCVFVNKRVMLDCYLFAYEWMVLLTLCLLPCEKKAS